MFTIDRSLNLRYPEHAEKLLDLPEASRSVCLALILVGFLSFNVMGTPVPATPWFSPGPGTYTYSSALMVKLADTTPGAVIYYTTDGTAPNVHSKPYIGPITVPGMPITETIKAIAVLNGVFSWSVATAAYTVVPQLPVPSLSPSPGTLMAGQQITIKSDVPGAVIHYTADGTAVSANSPIYMGPIIVSTASSLISTMVTLPGYSASNQIMGKYVIGTPTPVISTISGTYPAIPSVTITDPLQGAKIHYTVDGSLPTTASALYTGPFLLAATTVGRKTIQAIATATDHQQSVIATATFNLTLPAGVIGAAAVDSTPNISIPPDFLGLSHEWNAAQIMMGSTTLGIDPLYSTLLGHLSQNMNGSIVVRVGGGSTDLSGPVAAAAVQPFVELAKKLPVKFILGVNLGANNLSLAEEQGSTFVSNMPSADLMALEIGNEPDGYAKNYRPDDYSFSSFLPEYQQWRKALRNQSQRTVAISGPTFGGGYWDTDAEAAIATGTLQADIVTQHEYLACYNPAAPEASDYLLQPSSAQMHFLSVLPYIAAAHAANLPFRIAEMNSICMGGQPGLSDTFSSALWSIDAMFEYAKIGVGGVNWISSYQGGPYDLFQIHVWKKTNGLNGYTLGTVRPLYYGLLFFTRAAGHGSKLLPVSTLTDSNLKIWATLDSEGKAHVTIINKEQKASGNVEFTLDGFSSGTVTGLSDANGYLATTGVTFGGQTFDKSVDGSLQGSLATQKVIPSGNVWSISVQPMSAVLVDLEP